MVGEVLASLSDDSIEESALADAEHIAKGLTLDAINGRLDGQ